MKTGKFVISLDFELMWGVRDKRTINDYGQNILNVHQVVPQTLELFRKYTVCGTFSTVGFLFFKTKEELLANLPSIKPQYEDKSLSPYENSYFESLGSDFNQDKYHFAPLLIDEIKKYPEQEIGTHTFSHYYCLEKGQTLESFREDTRMAVQIAKEQGIVITSLIFPRNQFNDKYLQICSELGITCYRGNEHSWLYKAKSGENESLFRRAFRLMDSYINISGHNCYSDDYIKKETPVNIPSSRFLRPFSPKLSFLENLRLSRIKESMTFAAKNNLTYHLWWHPHNFGANMEENFKFLEKILQHYKFLNKKYNFQSYTMSSLAAKMKNEG